MSDKFEIDQPCVCIIGGEWWVFPPADKSSFPPSPLLGSVYIVKDITRITDSGEQVLVLKLYELASDCWYYATGFRPCRKTSIEQFNRLLNPIPKKKELVGGTFRVGDKTYPLENFEVRLPK